MHQEHKSQFLSVFDFINFLIDANLSAQIFEALNFFQLSFLLTSTSIRIVLVQLQRIVYIAIVYKEKDTFKFQKAIPGDAWDLCWHKKGDGNSWFNGAFQMAFLTKNEGDVNDDDSLTKGIKIRF